MKLLVYTEKGQMDPVSHWKTPIGDIYQARIGMSVNYYEYREQACYKKGIEAQEGDSLAQESSCGFQMIHVQLAA